MSKNTVQEIKCISTVPTLDTPILIGKGGRESLHLVPSASLALRCLTGAQQILNNGKRKNKCRPIDNNSVRTERELTCGKPSFPYEK